MCAHKFVNEWDALQPGDTLYAALDEGTVPCCLDVKVALFCCRLSQALGLLSHRLHSGAPPPTPLTLSRSESKKLPLPGLAGGKHSSRRAQSCDTSSGRCAVTRTRQRNFPTCIAAPCCAAHAAPPHRCLLSARTAAETVSRGVRARPAEELVSACTAAQTVSACTAAEMACRDCHSARKAVANVGAHTPAEIFKRGAQVGALLYLWSFKYL